MTTTMRITSTSERTRRRIRHIGAISHGGVAVAARRAAATRRELSPGARATLAAYVPGTVLKAGSKALADADIWTLVMASTPATPRLVRGEDR